MLTLPAIARYGSSLSSIIQIMLYDSTGSIYFIIWRCKYAVWQCERENGVEHLLPFLRCHIHADRNAMNRRNMRI